MMISRIRRTIPLALGFLALASLPSGVRAQGNTFNPYGNSGYSDYREFGTPMYSNNPALPGQALLNGKPLITKPRANSFQQFSDELNGGEGDSSSASGRAAPGESYFQAYQRSNARYNRVYRPNDTPENRKFEERQKQRDALYAKALEERDPVKRAQLLRQVQQDSITRPATSARPKAAAGTTATQPNRATPATSPLSRAPASNPATTPSANGERRVPAPSPYPSSRQPSTSGPTTRRAPSPYHRSSTPGSSSSRPGSTATRSDDSSGPAPDPSTIPIPPPR